jgi:outer membrane immunogenic protein
MKNLGLYLAAGLAGLVVASAAQSADLPKLVVKAAPAARSGDWTGFYVGVQAGGGWGRAGQTDASPFDTGWYNLSGGLAGVTWGYNWQVGNTVIGFESDAAWSNIRGSTDGANALNGPCGGAPSRCAAELQWFGTDRLRLGYAFGRWLPFVAGGMAWGYVHGKEGDTLANPPTGSGGEFHYGWTAGGGVEAMIDPHWSAKVEYLYADLRDGLTFVDQFGGGGAADQSVRMQVHIVRAGLNYKFDSGHSLVPFLPPNPGPSAGPWSWTGLYVGVNYGGGAGQASQSDNLFDRGTYNVGGAIAGGTVGYNWQRGSLVYGLEGDMDYSSIKGGTSGMLNVTTPPCGAFSSLGNCDTKLRWLGTARARVGVGWDRLLPYVTGGVAVGSLRSSEGDLQSLLTGSGSVTRAGWTAGAGIEARIDNRWSTKLEYLYVDLGSGTVFTEPSGGGATVSENVTFRTHIVRGGLNYRFN